MALSILYCNDILINLFDYMNYDDSTNLSKCSKNIRLKYIKYFRLIDNQHIIGKVIDSRSNKATSLNQTLRIITYDDYICKIRFFYKGLIGRVTRRGARYSIVCSKRNDTNIEADSDSDSDSDYVCGKIELGSNTSPSKPKSSYKIINGYIVTFEEISGLIRVNFYSLPKLEEKLVLNIHTNKYFKAQTMILIDKISTDLKYIIMFIYHTNHAIVIPHIRNNIVEGELIMLKCDELCYSVTTICKNILFDIRHKNEKMIEFCDMIDAYNKML